MKESILKKYLDGDISVEDLMADVKGSQQQTSADTFSVYVEKSDDAGEYQVTRQHLLKLCNDAIAENIEPIELNTIAFALVCSEYFSWDRDESTTDGAIIANTIYDWDNPEIGYPLTKENLVKWRMYLTTGVSSFTRKDLRK